MARKLYVGNLPYRFDDAALEQLFARVGEVSFASIVKDHETGRPRGFGFVEMASDEAAQKAIAELHQSEVEGRALVVNEARPREKRGPGPGPDRAPGGRGRERTDAGRGPSRPESRESRRPPSAGQEPDPFARPDRSFGERGSRRGREEGRDRGRERRRDDFDRGSRRGGKGKRGRGSFDDDEY